MYNLIVLSCNSLTKAYLVDNILDDVSFSINQNEKVGLVGLNGAGKSTLFNILTGELSADSGTIYMPKDCKVGILRQQTSVQSENTIYEELLSVFSHLSDMEQDLRELEQRISEEGSLGHSDALEKLMSSYANLSDKFQAMNGYGFKSEVKGVLKGLGFSEDQLSTPISSLSGGQKARVALGKILLENPQILLLDEPTNHLDIEAISWLEKYIKDYKGTIILISHDRYFLDSTVSRIFHLEGGKLNAYNGNYTQFVKKRKKDIEFMKKQFEIQQKEISELKEFVEKNKARASTRNMAMSRQKKLDKMDVIELAREKPKPEFNFKYGKTSGKLIFEAVDLVIGYDSPLSSPLNLRMERGQKVALTGANGIGKTTLLKSIIGELTPLSGSVQLGESLQIGYFEQEIKKANYNTCIEEIWNEFPSLSQYEVRAALAKCGLTTEHIESKVYVLSGGEQAKVRLCKLINKESNLLVLDEPTNHLDVDAKEELKRALKAYKGSIILISHEPEFYRDVATDVWNCESWTTKLF